MSGSPAPPGPRRYNGTVVLLLVIAGITLAIVALNLLGGRFTDRPGRPPPPPVVRTVTPTR